MTPHVIHLRIARLVVDEAVGDAAALSRDPARLAAAIAAQLQGGLVRASGCNATLPGALADAVATWLVSAGVPAVHTGGRHGDA